MEDFRADVDVVILDSVENKKKEIAVVHELTKLRYTPRGKNEDLILVMEINKPIHFYLLKASTV